VSYQGHVAAEQSPFYRILEGASDDEMYFQHGLGCQWSPVVDGVQLPVIERLQMVGSEPYPEMTDGGEDVPVGLAPGIHPRWTGPG
jgi:hypothetical protein